MNHALIVAAVGLALVGLVHSVLGEILVFRALRTHGVDHGRLSSLGYSACISTTASADVTIRTPW